MGSGFNPYSGTWNNPNFNPVDSGGSGIFNLADPVTTAFAFLAKKWGVFDLNSSGAPSFEDLPPADQADQIYRGFLQEQGVEGEGELERMMDAFRQVRDLGDEQTLEQMMNNPLLRNELAEGGFDTFFTTGKKAKITEGQLDVLTEAFNTIIKGVEDGIYTQEQATDGIAQIMSDVGIDYDRESLQVIGGLSDDYGLISRRWEITDEVGDAAGGGATKPASEIVESVMGGASSGGEGAGGGQGAPGSGGEPRWVYDAQNGVFVSTVNDGERFIPRQGSYEPGQGIYSDEEAAQVFGEWEAGGEPQGDAVDPDGRGGTGPGGWVTLADILRRQAEEGQGGQGPGGSGDGTGGDGSGDGQGGGGGGDIGFEGDPTFQGPINTTVGDVGFEGDPTFQGPVQEDDPRNIWNTTTNVNRETSNVWNTSTTQNITDQSIRDSYNRSIADSFNIGDINDNRKVYLTLGAMGGGSRVGEIFKPDLVKLSGLETQLLNSARLRRLKG